MARESRHRALRRWSKSLALPWNGWARPLCSARLSESHTRGGGRVSASTSCRGYPLTLGPDAREGKERPVIVQAEPDHILFARLGILLRSVFGKAVCRHQRAVFRLQPGTPVRGRRVTDVRHWKISRTRWWRHSPAHHRHLASRTCVANDRSRIARKDTRHRR